MILGAPDANPTDADNLGVRVSADPFGHRARSGTRRATRTS